ncbi:MAG: hypothetical protein ACRCSG_01655, partial [Cellulosilyticaceae bacterium]
ITNDVEIEKLETSTDTTSDLNDNVVQNQPNINNMQYQNNNNLNNNNTPTFFQSKNIFALLGFIFSCLSFFTLASSVPGIILGVLGLVESKKMNGYGKGMSIAAICIPLVLFLIVVFACIIFGIGFILLQLLTIYY